MNDILSEADHICALCDIYIELPIHAIHKYVDDSELKILSHDGEYYNLVEAVICETLINGTL